jgi:isopenicillin-N epimerase
LAVVRQLFLLDPDVVFLNHGSFGACPKPVFAEYQRLQLELEREPVEFLGLGRRFPELIGRARSRIAEYVGARDEDLVLVPNATAGVNLVARSLSFEPGDEVVATTHEYGGNEILWRHLAETRGIRYVEVDPPEVLEALSERTRLVFVSHITSATALVLPVEAICVRARELGALSLVDGAHAPGQVAVDVDAVGADFYAGNCHKWLCAPKGAGFLHVREEAQALLEPLAYSWDWPQGTFAERHRWSGTRDPSPWLAVPAAIDFQAEHDWDAVRARCHRLAVRAREELTALLGTTAYAEHDDEFVQMVSVRLPPCDTDDVRRRLFDEHRIEVAASEWRGEPKLRVSFQGYNDDSDLDALLEALPRVLR